MREEENLVKIIMFWLSLISLTFAMSVDLEKDASDCHDQSLGIIVAVNGKANVLSEKSIRKHKAIQGEKLFAGDKLITNAKSKLIMELADGSKVILNESSELILVRFDRMKQDSGEVYYQIKKRVGTKGLKVETSFSIIGIKGTEFIVDLNEKGEIALNEGLVGIESLHAEFELHRQKLMQEYEKYKKEQIDGFEAFKSMEEIVSYVKEFDLEAGKKLSFGSSDLCQDACESHVSENEFSDETKERFEAYRIMLRK